MNKVILIGHLGKDPEVRYGANNTAVARFSVGVQRRFKREGEKDADFLNCVAFGNTAEFIGKYFHKGHRIALSGRIQTGDYTNRDGVKIYTTDIVVEEAEFCQSKQEGQKANNEAMGRQEPSYTQPTDGDGFMTIPDGLQEELPWA